jgi:hypothetical protein
MPVAVAVATTTITNDADPTKKRTFDEVDNHDDNHDNDDDNLDLESGFGMAAFFHYAEANHEQVKEKLGTDAKALGKVAAELANNYRALSGDEMKKWQEMALTSNTAIEGQVEEEQEDTTTRKRKVGQRGKDTVPRKPRTCPRCKRYNGENALTCEGRVGNLVCRYFEEDGNTREAEKEQNKTRKRKNRQRGTDTVPRKPRTCVC